MADVPTATFASRLNDLKWRFHEAGMSTIWNELKRFANGTAVTPETTYGENLYSLADINPIVDPQTAESDDGTRRGTGDLYADTRNPIGGFIER